MGVTVAPSLAPLGNAQHANAPRAPEGSEPEPAQLLGVALPLLGDLHPQVQVHLAADELVDLGAGAGPTSFSREPPRPMMMPFWLSRST